MSKAQPRWGWGRGGFLLLWGVGVWWLLGGGWVPMPAQAFEVRGLATPESFQVDPETGEYYISNIQGAPTRKDDNGFITHLDARGRVLDLRFVDGARPEVTLHAPKGLAIVGDVVYVTDIDAIRGFDKQTGTPRVNLDLSRFGAVFLNDLTADAQGILYVSDMVGNFILKIHTREEHRVEPFLRSPVLGGPNGLALDPRTGHLLVATWGTARILEIGPDRRVRTRVRHPAFQNLDGLVVTPEGTLYVSSFTAGKIFRVLPDGTVQTFRSGLASPADIGLDLRKGWLLVPYFEANWAETLPIR